MKAANRQLTDVPEEGEEATESLASSWDEYSETSMSTGAKKKKKKKKKRREPEASFGAPEVEPEESLLDQGQLDASEESLESLESLDSTRSRGKKKKKKKKRRSIMESEEVSPKEVER